MNPLEHRHISMKEAIFINSGEAMVIYRAKKVTDHDIRSSNVSNHKDPDTKSQEVERVVKHGPCQYIPEPEEWTHKFKWHGSDAKDKTHKAYGNLQFTKLRTIADQTYYNVWSNHI